jgi:tetratricopeptide (TPR) repeat protein
MPEEKSPQLTDLLQQAQAARLANQLDLAAHILGVAFEKHPDALPVAWELALLHQQRGEWPEARACLELILAQEPLNAQALNALGMAWLAQRNLSRAIECWQKAVSINPEYADVWQNIALAYEHLNQLPEAIAAHQRVVSLIPQDSKAHRLLGMAQLDYSLLPAANLCFERALELDPNDPENLWQRFFIRALAGDFPDAWQDYECRFKLQSRTTPDHRFTQPRWKGEPLPEQTILLHAEQGFGDTIQMIRYAPRVSELVNKVIIWIPKPLEKLMNTVEGIDRVITHYSASTQFDVHLPLMSLPGVFQDSLESIPTRTPYLGAPSFQENTRPIQKVGISWAGSGTQPLDRRSVPFEQFYTLFQDSSIEWHNLQHDTPTPSGLVDHSSEMADFSATADIIDSLDLIITIDSAIAHLAGAMGKPVWVLLNFAADWRWGLDKNHTPWYPSARLFRQSTNQPWSSVMANIQSSLIRPKKR